MLSFGSVLTRSNPLHNSNFRYGIKETYSYKCFSTMINNFVNKPVINNEQTKINARQVNKNVFVRKFYIHSSLNCMSLDNEDKLQKSLNIRQSSSKIKDNLFGRVNNSIKNDDVETNEDHLYNPPPVNNITHHQAKKERYSLKDIEKMYLNPKAKLHEVYQIIKNDRGKSLLSFEFTEVDKKNVSKHSGWTCHVNVSWPNDMKFSAHAGNKNSAASQASLKCLHWLENNKKLIKGQPVLYDSQSKANLLKTPIPLSVSQDILYEAKLIAEKYDENIKPLIDDTENNVNYIKHQKFQTGAIIDPVGRANPVSRFEDKITERNRVLQLRYENRIVTSNYSNLPILKYREQIIKAIEDNQVLLIKGDTGCGKTTQVPQYIMDSFAKNGLATDCNMIVSQPRRISAISLAERVAEERKEQMGDVVGFQVRLDQFLPNTPAGILFCTTGILLRKLQFNPTLQGCSHVIVDEAHERTINTDMLLVLLKRLLENNSKLKVIVMSATINAELFQSYFNSNVIEIPGRAFPVEMNFMEDINTLGLRAPSRWDLSFQDADAVNGGPSVDIVKMGELVSYIVRNKPPGAILCFLPGWVEIMMMKKYLEQFTLIPREKLLILPLHSKIAPYEQKKIFYKPLPDVRKIVLATDIAETGITVTDIVYVVDSCIHKQIRWQEKRGISSIDNYWVSKANVMQRKGRAGRVKPGTSYHFISKSKFDSLEPYPAPEIKCSSLEKTVLDIKTYSDEKAITFLRAMPQPPAITVINQAIQDLFNLGALDSQENLTPLGKRIAFFTVHPKLSKAMVYSTIFQCVSPIMTIASIMSTDSSIFTEVLNNKEKMRNIKKKYHPSSDHVGLAWLFEQWNSFNARGKMEARNFCFQSHIFPERMNTLSKIRTLNAECLTTTRMLADKFLIDDKSTTENEYSELDELVKGILLSGVDNVLLHRNFDIRKGLVKKGVSTLIMEDGHRATLTPDSVNFKRKKWPSHFLTYVRCTHSEERRTSLIRESSIISPLTVFLFSQARILGYIQKNDTKTVNNDDDSNNNNNNYDSDDENYKEESILFNVQNRQNINLSCNRETADILIHFRDSMWSIVRYMIENYDVTKSTDTEVFEQVNAFRVEMMRVLAKMLSESSVAIDEPDQENKSEPVRGKSRDEE